MKRSFRGGFVALVGDPNVGKSTLLNCLIGQNLAIVSDKPQTTRKRLLGLYSTPDCQIAFVDAPGFTDSATELHAFLQSEAEDTIRGADLVLVLFRVDVKADKVKDQVEAIVRLRGGSENLLVLFTQADIGPFSVPLNLTVPFLRVSAMKKPKQSREDILEFISGRLPEIDGPMFEPELLTTETIRNLAAEYIREACFQNLRQEVPFGVATRIVRFEESSGKQLMPRIFAEIVVNREKHKPIVIGNNGEMIRKIGTLARKRIEALYGGQVYLGLEVVVRENWQKNPRLMKELGYVFRTES